MNKLTQTAMAAMIVALSGTVALAVVPLRIPLQGVIRDNAGVTVVEDVFCLLYTSPSPRDRG